MPSRFCGCCEVFFFFSSRRRHTRFKCDWSSDVCSSDLSDLLGLHFSATSAVRHARDKVTHEIRLAMQGNALRPVFQPVYTVATGKLHGFECLSRFDLEPRRPPDHWFNAAHEGGLGLELDRHPTATPLHPLARLPTHLPLPVTHSTPL